MPKIAPVRTAAAIVGGEHAPIDRDVGDARNAVGHPRLEDVDAAVGEGHADGRRG